MDPLSRKAEQPCWKCKKWLAGCNWSKYFIPVKGWIATPTRIGGNSGGTDSYRITWCPEFELEDHYDCEKCKNYKTGRCYYCCFRPGCENPQNESPIWDAITVPFMENGDV